MPHTLRSLELTDEFTAELSVLVGFDQDLAARGYPHFQPDTRPAHPVPPVAGTRVWAPASTTTAVTWLLERYGSLAALRKDRPPQARRAPSGPRLRA